jgi:DHA2 family multidrug resistance protein-like MFS transporter
MELDHLAERAGARQWAGLAVLMLPAALIAIDGNVLGFALPSLGAYLRPSATQTLWIVDLYAFVLAGLLVTMGNVGDLVGRRRLLMIGMAGFGAASLACAYAQSPAELIAGRALLGLAGATLMPSTMSLLRSMFRDEQQRVFALAVWSTAFSAGSGLGPVIGGWLLGHFWWGSVFLLNVPFVLFALILTPVLVDESRNPGQGRIDLLSVALSLATALPLVYGFKEIAKRGASWEAGCAILLGALSGWVFLRRQRRLAEPLLDFGLFRDPRFSIAVVASLAVVASVVGTMFLLPQYLQLVLGLPMDRAGFMLLPWAVSSAVSGFAAAAAMKRTSERTLINGGLGLMTLGVLGLLGLRVDYGVLCVTASSVAIGFGFGFTMTVFSASVLDAAPPERAGAAAAISETAIELGVALGVALFGSVVNAVYQLRLRLPPGVDPARADGAHETLGGALAAGLGESARKAFVEGLWAASSVGVLLLLACVVGMLRAKDR